MSEHLFKFLLSELKTVRLHYKHPGCGAVIEVTADRLAKVFQEGDCPVCKLPLVPAVKGAGNDFGRLADVLRAFGASQDVDVEFVLPPR